MYKILITSSDKHDVLRRISLDLINQKLSPCTHIIKNIESFYLWNGTLTNDNENLLLIKSHVEDIPLIENIIIKHHNYENPEIISHEFNVISKQYKKWFDG